MKHALLVLAMMAAGPVLGADEKDAPARRASEMADALRAMGAVMEAVAAADAAHPADVADAPRRLAEALTRGSATAADAAVITRWILEAREEAVAHGIGQALASADRGQAGGGQRWAPATAALVVLFRSALADAETHRRRDVADWPELDALARAAAPAVRDSLQEVDPATRDQLLALVRAAMEGLRDERR